MEHVFVYLSTKEKQSNPGWTRPLPTNLWLLVSVKKSWIMLRSPDPIAEARGLFLPWNGALILSTLPREWNIRRGDRLHQPCNTVFLPSPHTERNVQVELARKELSFVPSGACLPRLTACLDRNQSGSAEAVPPQRMGLCLCPRNGSYTDILSQNK